MQIKKLRVLAGLAAISLTIGSLGVVNYSVRQENSEYATLRHANLLQIPQSSRESEIALLMAMASKESSFYDAAVGLDNEAGLVQLKPDTAREAGLKVPQADSKRPSILEKILFISASSQEKEADERLDKGKNLQASYLYLQRLSKRIQKNYGMNGSSALDFALIAYNFGPGNVDKLLKQGYPQNPEGFINRLLSGENQDVSARKRIVVANHFQKVKDLQKMYERALPAMIQQGNPTLIDYVENSFRVLKKVVDRIN